MTFSDFCSLFLRDSTGLHEREWHTYRLRIGGVELVMRRRYL